MPNNRDELETDATLSTDNGWFEDSQSDGTAPDLPTDEETFEESF